jgi:hypothetical protein
MQVGKEGEGGKYQKMQTIGFKMCCLSLSLPSFQKVHYSAFRSKEVFNFFFTHIE